MARRVFPVLSRLRRLFRRTDGPHGARPQERFPGPPSGPIDVCDADSDDLLVIENRPLVTDPDHGDRRRLPRGRRDVEALLLEQFRAFLDELSRRRSGG